MRICVKTEYTDAINGGVIIFVPKRLTCVAKSNCNNILLPVCFLPTEYKRNFLIIIVSTKILVIMSPSEVKIYHSDLFVDVQISSTNRFIK
jgi:hypothetical protein